MSYFVQIPFQHFHIEVSEGISQIANSLLNPYTQTYFKFGTVYLAVTTNNNILTIEYAQNTGKKHDKLNWLVEMEKIARTNKNKAVRFLTTKDNIIVNKLARDWNCKLIETKANLFGSGMDYLIYEHELIYDTTENSI